MDNLTIKDIAKKCGVGISTVSRAMNNHPDVNEKTKKEIMKVIEEYNYIPNNSARNLKRSESRTIAVLIKGIGNPFFSKMIKYIEQEIQKKRYSIVLHHVDEGEDEVGIALQLTKEKRLKGIVFLGGYLIHTPDKLKQLTVPCVLSTVSIIEGGNISYVCVDDEKESYKIVDYLCKLGHKKIAILCASVCDESIGKLRLKGYERALRDNDIDIDPELICRMREDLDTYSLENGYETTKALLDAGKEFTAIFSISDTMAIGACRAIFDAGKKVPEDYSIVGFDGLDFGAYYNPTITTIRQPIEEMAKATFSVLHDMIKKKKVFVQKVFDAELVEGGSVQKI